MSFLNFIGSGRKQAATVRPVATTGKADTAPIHAHITNPSRKPSIDSLASASQGRRQPSRALTDVPSSHSQSPRVPSRSSTSALEMGSSTGRRPRGKVLYTPALTSTSSSLSSLVDTIDSVHISSSPKNLPGTDPHPPNKASSSLEQEWSEVENDSSDEDDFVVPKGGSSVLVTADKGKDQRYAT
jgi:hypothetical protein